MASMIGDTPSIISVIIVVATALGVAIFTDYSAARPEVRATRFEVKQLDWHVAGGDKDAFDNTRDAAHDAQPMA